MENKHDILDQLPALVQNTKHIAETLLVNQQEEQSRDHKVDIIGTAIINQRDDLQKLVLNGQHIHEEMLVQVERSDQQKNHIVQLIEKSDNRFRFLQKTHEMQH